MAPEYLEMQVLPPDFDPKLERRKVKRVKGVLEPSKYKKGNKCSKVKRSDIREQHAALTQDNIIGIVFNIFVCSNALDCM